MTSHSPKECPICQEEYNEEERSPRVLPCSHTLCSECIDSLIGRNLKTCPFCIRAFDATAARDVGVNTALLDIMKLLKKMELGVPSPRMGTTSSLSKLVNEVKRETQSVFDELLSNCQKTGEEIDRVLQSNKLLLNYFSKAKDTFMTSILAPINEMVTLNDCRICYLKEHDRRLEGHKLMISEKRKQINEAKMKLVSAETVAEAGLLADEADTLKTDILQRLQSIVGQLTEDEKMRQKMEKVAEATKDYIAQLEKILKSALGNDEGSFVPDLQHMKVQEVVCQITIETLRSKSEQVLKLIRQGKIFAIQELEGRNRYAPISLQEKNKIVLHHLREQRVSCDTHLLKHTNILKLIDVSSRMVFLQLSSENKGMLGKLYISLFPNSKRAEQFALLCTGEKGPSYVKSKLLSVVRRGENDEGVRCGDYENLGGNGGKALVPDVWKEEEEAFIRFQLAGILWGRDPEAGEAEASQFWIFTKDCPKYELDWCFGKVEEGLPILQEAIDHHADITKVIISDAGLVLPI